MIQHEKSFMTDYAVTTPTYTDTPTMKCDTVSLLNSIEHRFTSTQNWL